MTKESENRPQTKGGWFTSGRRSWFRPLEVVTPLTPAVLDGYYKYVRNGLMADMVFLRGPIAWRRFWSNAIKLVALIALAVGVLMPIVHPGNFTSGSFAERSGAEVALIAVASGGLLLLLDRLFNVSGSWTRLMLAELQVQKLLIGLQFEWAKRRPAITNANIATDGPVLIDLLSAAAKESNAVMEAQKRTWATELDTASAALAARLENQQATLTTLVQQQQAERKPGGLNIKIDRPGELEGPLKILVNGTEKASSATPQASLAISGVAAGLTKVKVTAKRKAPAGGDFAFEKVVDVPTDGVSEVAVTV